MDDEVVSVRIPRKDLESIDRRVREGQFMNRSDLVRHAVRGWLEENREEPALAPIGSLAPPVASTAAPARRSPRGLKR